MKPLRLLLVDDEKPARRRLRALLADQAGVEVVGEAESAAEAARQCAELHPDVLLLDVQMPRGDGFSLLPLLTPPLPRVIFVTAHDEYAVRAFEVNAVDYLLKPVSAERLQAALARLERPTPPAPRSALAKEDRVLLSGGTVLRFVAVHEICAVEADGNYGRVRLPEGKSVFVSRPLGEWESLLPAPPFVRVERSLLVNVERVRALRVEHRGAGWLQVGEAGEPLPLGRAALARLRPLLREGLR